MIARLARRRFAPAAHLTCKLPVFLLAALAALFITSSAYAAPPTGVAASAGNVDALITWSTVSGATGYNVYRSTASGSGYTLQNASPLTGNAYIDSGLTNSTTYYYVVTDIVSGTESGDSSQVSATPAAQPGTWSVTCSSSNSNSGASFPTSLESAITLSDQSTLNALSNVAGTTSSTVDESSEANYSSVTWTATWKPTGSAWPEMTVITGSNNQNYMATVSNGEGTATVANTGGSTLLTVTYPNSLTGSTSQSGPTLSYSTSDLTNLTITTTGSMSSTEPVAPSGTTVGWSVAQLNSTTTQEAITPAWFEANFSSPSAVTLTFTVTSQDITSSSSLGSATSGLSSADATVSTIYAAN